LAIGVRKQNGEEDLGIDIVNELVKNWERAFVKIFDVYLASVTCKIGNIQKPD
jgi:hypothetical protein